jgi:predicted metal-dependent hydrolase
MSIKQETLEVANIHIEIVRKEIKNMHLGVYPPLGRVRLAAPSSTDDEVIRLFAISKLGWIKKHIKNFQNQEREQPREYISGESHYLFGQRYLLNLVESNGHSKVQFKNNRQLNLLVKPDTTRDEKARVVKEWYRKELKSLVPGLLNKWETVIGVTAYSWGVKHMKTKWGACNIQEKRIWLNLELAKKPKSCLEYIIVHELVHLLERNHNDNFIAYMNRFMPNWRQHRDELNRLPVSHSDWGY